MIKRIIILISLLIFGFGDIFAYHIGDIKKLYNDKLNILEHKIELKYNNDKSKICYYKKIIYKKIDNVLKLYENKYPKYATIFKILLEINNYREININSNCDRILEEKLKENKTIQKNNNIKNNSNSNTTNNNLNNSSNYKDNDKLKSKLGNINYDYNGTITFNTIYNSIKLPTVGEIENIYNNFTIKVNNHWISMKKILIIKVPEDNLQYGINYAKKNYNKDYIFYKKIANEYKIYLIDKKDIYIINPFDPSKSEEYNVNQLQKAGYLYIKDFLYKTTNKNGIIIGGLFKYNDKLYYIKLTGTGQYYEISQKNFIENLKNLKKGTIITKGKNNLIAWKNGIKLFYLGDFSIYKNIDLEKFGKIIDFTFYIIGKYNLPYSVQNMYDLINFTKQFEGKSLKDAYKRIILNYKYNKKVNNILNERGMNQNILNNEVKANKKLIQNWDIFYTLKHKEGICQSISDIFSLIALFNGKQADTVVGMSKNGYLHQISKIEYRYYDPTYDLNNNGRITHFAITKQQVEKYLDLKSK